MLSDIGAGRRRILTGIAAVVAASTGASAQGGQSSSGEAGGQDRGQSRTEAFGRLSPAEKWRRRFPQSVLVSDLIGRKVLDREQVVLGFVEAIVAAPDGEIHVAFRRRRLLVFRGDTVVVPNVLAALLGPFVILPEASDGEIAGLPAYQPSGYTVVDPASRIRMALTKH